MRCSWPRPQQYALAILLRLNHKQTRVSHCFSKLSVFLLLSCRHGLKCVCVRVCAHALSLRIWFICIVIIQYEFHHLPLTWIFWRYTQNGTKNHCMVFQRSVLVLPFVILGSICFVLYCMESEFIIELTQWTRTFFLCRSLCIFSALSAVGTSREIENADAGRSLKYKLVNHCSRQSSTAVSVFRLSSHFHWGEAVCAHCPFLQ